MVEEEPLKGYASAKLPSFLFIFTLIRGCLHFRPFYIAIRVEYFYRSLSFFFFISYHVLLYLLIMCLQVSLLWEMLWWDSWWFSQSWGGPYTDAKVKLGPQPIGHLFLCTLLVVIKKGVMTVMLSVVISSCWGSLDNSELKRICT